MKNCTFLLLPLLISLLSACQSNKYSDYYSVLIDDNYVRIDEPAKLIELADSSQIAKLQATDDYILIGTSSFYDLWVPRIFAVDCAKKYGACMVVLSYQKGETKEDCFTMNVPTSQTTYHWGTIYGSYGRYANFHGSSRTYGSTPVTINYSNTYYNQQAYFFGKRKNKNSFGIYFHLPENIPGNTEKKNSCSDCCCQLTGCKARNKSWRCCRVDKWGKYKKYRRYYAIHKWCRKN